MSTQTSLHRQLLLGIFVVSGFSGLIYESIWSHYLKLFLGHAAYAQTLVLVIFMGGMALGSWLVGRYSARIKRLLWGYVLVEAIIGLLGLVFHRSFVAVTDFSFESVIPALSSNALVHAYKWSLAAALILPQSVLLGMTFPLISGGIIRRWPERPGETLSMLYFTNCLGAALGVLVSGFVLIDLVGLPGTILTAGLINVVLALVVWALVRGQIEPAAAASSAPAEPGQAQRWFVVAAFCTGAATFLYEIGWIRMLSLVLGSSSHAFELMLSAFIFGLAFGGLWMRKRIDRLHDPLRYLAAMMILMGTLAVLTLPTYDWTFDFMAWALRTFTPVESGYKAFNVVSQAIAMLVMLPTTFCAGTTLPLLTHALLKRSRSERAIGSIYAANTLGTIIGTLIAIHLLMPLVGVKGVIVSGGMVHMALGLSALVIAGSLRPALRIAVAACCTGLIGLVIVRVSLDPVRMTSSVYRSGQSTLPPGARVTYLRDGKTATVSLVELDDVVSIATNGKTDAAIRMGGTGEPAIDEITMVFAAALPLSMHPRPERVANIGFGSGLTSATVLLSDRVRALDTIELEPFMVEAARSGYLPRIGRVFEDPRSRIVFEDAKTFFATANEPYDVIISEPSNPWVSGVATLFSEEFYRRLVSYLKADGYLVQWLQAYETDMTIVASIIKAMAPHFGSYAVYNVNDSDILIVATRGARLRAPDPSVFDAPLLRAELERVGIESIDDIRLRRIGDERTIGPLLATYPSPANSDFFPFVDLNAARLRFMRQNAIELPELLMAPVPVLDLLQTDPPEFRREPPPTSSMLSKDRLTRRALDLRDGVLSGRLEGVDPSLAVQVMAIDASREECADPGVRQAWQRAIHIIGRSTTPYLSGGDLNDMWTRILASPCYRDTSGQHKLWADLAAAVARRDAAEMARAGSSLLAQPQENVGDNLDYLITAVAAAQLKLGNVDRARSLLERWAAENHAPEYKLPLRQLFAIARSRDAANGEVQGSGE